MRLIFETFYGTFMRHFMGQNIKNQNSETLLNQHNLILNR